MKTLILTTFLLTSSLFAATESELRDELSKQVCLTKLSLELEEFKKIPDYYFNSEDEKKSLLEVQQELQKLENEYFDALVGWRMSFKKDVKDLTELSSLINSLDKSDTYTEKLKKVLKQEESYNKLIRLHELIFQERLLAINKAASGCPSNQELLKELQTQIETTQKDIALVKAVSTASLSKRNLLLDIAKKSIRLELETQYAVKAQIDIREVGKRLSALASGLNINLEMDNYYRQLTQARMSYSTLLNIYLQYEAPLNIIRGAIAKGEEFKQRVNKLNLTRNEQEVLFKNLELYLAPLQKALSETLKGGPEKKRERQKFMAQEYKKVVSQLSAICLPAIAGFEQNPSEKTYANIVDSCKKGGVK